eukprot:COSAG05_NODE_1483_length_4745_cov_252.653681_1_plen_89_part_00
MQAEEARALEAQRQKMCNGCVAASVPRYYAAAACRDERKALGGQGDARGGRAVAAHWLDVRAYYCAVVMGSLMAAFFIAGFISAAKSL